MEFRVWTELIQQSQGALHVFLPLLDRGLDAVVHRLTDGEYIPLQVKGRTSAVNGFVEIVIPASELIDDRALIIAGLLTAEGLGPKLLVVDEATFKSRASRSFVQSVEVYAASFSMDSATSHWRPYLVPRERLGERLLGSPPPIPALESVEETVLPPIDRYARWLGFLGEAEVVRRLAENPELDVFRPFPDLEMVEVLTRNRITHRYCGLQVKTGVPTEAHDGEARIPIRKATLVPAPTTNIAALAWIAEQRQFADEFLLIPTTELVGVAVEGGAHLFLNFHPHSQERTRLDPYRRALSDLGQLAEDFCRSH
ncbi:MAG: hypothetical protein DMF54_10630 [Acidobacteria bacterium]|nr:MAG: hypothetical protein DMF54_10630 [Acidobacteriota bacterium]